MTNQVTVGQMLDAARATRDARMDPALNSGLYNRYLRWCGRCEGILRKDHWDKNNADKWMHDHKGGIWCRNDKQHGPKTRMAFPLPSLLVIEEIDL